MGCRLLVEKRVSVLGVWLVSRVVLLAHRDSCRLEPPSPASVRVTLSVKRVEAG